MTSDKKTSASLLFTRPPQVVLHPIGAGESRRLLLGDMVSLSDLAWFPDGKHMLLDAAVQGEPLRTFALAIDGGKPQAIGPADFRGEAVASDGKRIAGRTADGTVVIFDTSTQKVESVPGAAATDRIDRWTEDGQGLIVVAPTLWEAEIDRADVKTGKRTVLQKIALENRAGAEYNLHAVYAEKSKTSAYGTRRLLSGLLVLEGLE